MNNRVLLISSCCASLGGAQGGMSNDCEPTNGVAYCASRLVMAVLVMVVVRELVAEVVTVDVAVLSEQEFSSPRPCLARQNTRHPHSISACTRW